jgi:hypothetical protein
LGVRFVLLETGASGGLYAAEPATAPTWSGYYLPTAATADGKLPEAIEPVDAWSRYWGQPREKVNGGSYVFLGEPPSPPLRGGVTPSGVADALAALLKQLNEAHNEWAYRFLFWIAAPHKTPLQPEAVVAFAESAHPESGTLIESSSIPLRTLELVGEKQLTVTFEPADAALMLVPGGNPSLLRLMQTRGAQPKAIGEVTGSARLPVAGEQAGQLALALRMTVRGGGVEDDLGLLVSGVKYFYTLEKVVKSQLFRLLGVPKGQSQLRFAVTLDPLHAADEARTRFTFSADAGAFSTPLQTITGLPLTLTPITGASGLMLSPDVVTGPGGTQVESYYATLTGPYVLGGAGGTTERLLCGLSGLESIAVNLATKSYEGDRLTFHPGHPAHARVFPPSAASQEDPQQAGVGKPLLDETLSTAWVTIDAASNRPAANQPAANRPAVNANQPAVNSYYAQPSGAPMFSNVAADAAGLLDLHDEPVATAAAAFPLAAYSGIEVTPGNDGFDATLLAVYEQGVIGPTRRGTMQAHVLAARSRRAPTSNEGQGEGAATPQGFLVELAGATWTSLLLARTEPAGGSPGGKLSFSPVAPTLQAALQTDQLFLVATNPLPGFKGSIHVEGWPFEVNVGADQAFGAYSNVLIFKFCGGTLAELVGNPQRWTSGEAFNDPANEGLLALSQWLQDYIGESAASNDVALASFNALVNDPKWRGLLALSVDVPLDDLPAQVSALQCGIERTKLSAHHLGVEVNQLTPDGRSLAGESSVFGLIEYADPGYAQALAQGADPEAPIPSAPGLTYDFKVLQLLVLFENSEVRLFRSICQVTLTQWFGDAVIPPPQTGGPPLASIVLDGALQRHDGQPVYTFTSHAGGVAYLDSKALPSVTVATASLESVAAPAHSSVSTYRFPFTGTLQLANIGAAEQPSGLDPLSFDALGFQQIALEMQWDPKAAVPRTFRFATERAALDVGASVWREKSMFAALPLTIRDLLTGTAAPSSLGFVNVQLTGAPLSQLGGTWYGIAFDFDMGTPGALAAEAGLTATLMVAWGQGSKRNDPSPPRVAAGMQLPGASGGGKTFSLQGVLALTVDQIELSYTKESGEQKSAYMLRLTDIALSFLGVKFPPGYGTAFYLFGNPGTTTQRSPLGWYAALAKQP